MMHMLHGLFSTNYRQRYQKITTLSLIQHSHVVHSPLTGKSAHHSKVVNKYLRILFCACTCLLSTGSCCPTARQQSEGCACSRVHSDGYVSLFRSLLKLIVITALNYVRVSVMSVHAESESTRFALCICRYGGILRTSNSGWNWERWYSAIFGSAIRFLDFIWKS